MCLAWRVQTFQSEILIHVLVSVEARQICSSQRHWSVLVPQSSLQDGKNHGHLMSGPAGLTDHSTPFCCDKHHNQSKCSGEGSLFQFIIHHWGKLGQELKKEFKIETMGKCFLLAPRQAHAELESYTAQNTSPDSGTAHSDLSPPTSICKEENSHPRFPPTLLQTCL